MNMMLSEHESLAFISGRRSVFPKELEDEEVNRDEIMRLLEAARWAPTHKVTEPWRFVVVQGEALTEFRDIIEKVIIEKGLGKDPIEEKIACTFSKLDRVSALIAIVMKRDDRERIPEEEEQWATACAVQNVQLHAKSLSIGCYWSTGAGREHSTVRSFLGLAETDFHMGWLFIGRYSAEKRLIKERRPVSDYTKWL
jgi:nitroreductase